MIRKSAGDEAKGEYERMYERDEEEPEGGAAPSRAHAATKSSGLELFAAGGSRRGELLVKTVQ